MADLHDLDRAIGDKSGEWFVKKGKELRDITNFTGAAAAGPAPGNGTAGFAGPPGGSEAARLDAYDPTIFIFDAYPGGIGFSELLYGQHEDLLAAVRHLLRSCPCTHGCPSCVGPTLEVGPTAKEVALAILDRL